MTDYQDEGDVRAMPYTGGDTINSWRWRRLFLFGTQLFFMSTIQLLIWKDYQGPVAETIAWGCLGGMIANCGSYVFGAVWETNKARSVLGREGTAASLNVPIPPTKTEVKYVGDRRGPAAPPLPSTTVTTTSVTTQPAATPSATETPLVGEKA